MTDKFEFSEEQTQRLPIHIAKTTELLRLETNHRLCIWYSFEITEMVLKWVFAVTSAGVNDANGELPERLLNVIRGAIVTPTLGGWQAMAFQACKELKKLNSKTAHVAPFADFFKKYDTKYGKALSTWDRLKKTRNNVVHGGGLTENQARKIWKEMGPDITSVLVDLSDLHDQYDVWARFAGQDYNLEGTSSERTDCPHDLPRGDGTWLIDASGKTCPLQPLLVYEPVLETWEIDPVRSEERDVRKPVPQSYFKLEKGNLFYTPIGVDDNISINADLTLFNRLYASKDPDTPTTIYNQQITTMFEKHVLRFQGRTAELERVKDWRIGQTPKGERIGLIVGEPGFGKSALLAKAAYTYQQELDATKIASLLSVAHAFSAEDPMNDRRSFLLSLLQQVELWCGAKRSVAKATDQAKELEEKCIAQLDALFERFPENHLTVFIDGLDEIVPFDSKFPTLILSLLRPGVTIIATTRPIDFLNSFEDFDDVERIIFGADSNTLPGMTDNEVRAMLLEGLGARAQEVIALDFDDLRSGTARNAYIEKIVERAAGKPLYVELLIIDIVEYGVQIDPDARLPVSVERFYEQLLSRQGLSDTKSHLSVILCLLALAKEPLGSNVLVDLFVQSPGTAVTWDVAQAWVKNALDQGEVFLRPSFGNTGQITYTIYHQELKRFVLGEKDRGAPQLRWAFGLARWMLASASNDPTSARETATELHFKRFGFNYLLEHADETRPPVLDTSAVAFAENALGQTPQLKSALAAWQDDREAFLNNFADVYSLMKRGGLPSKQDEALNRLLKFALTETEFGLNCNVVHAVYSYSKETLPLFNALVDVALTNGFVDGLDLSAVGKLDLVNWTIKAGNMRRREGQLPQANKILETAEQQLDGIEGDHGQAIAKLRGVLYYEIGYVAYQASDGPLADELFEKSVEHAKQANDRNGEAISQIVRLNRKILFRLARGEDATDAFNEAELFLNQALEEFLQTARVAKEEEDRLTAERWVMNCRAHLFEVAFDKKDTELAEQRYLELLSDKWLQKDKTTRDDIIKRYTRRVALLRGDIAAAIAEYERSLPIISSTNSSDANKEGVARYYLEFANILIDQGEIPKAKQWLRSGLLTIDHMANRLWKPALQETLDRIS